MEVCESFLSERVKQMICVSGVSACTTSHEDNHYQYVKEGHLDWNQIKEILQDLGEPDDTYEYFENAARHFSTCFQECQHLLQSLSDEIFRDNFFKYLQWTSSPNVLLDAFSILKENVRDTGAIHSTLIITAILERSLGNVFLLRGKKCPSMLKDLLLTRELGEIFGPTIINFIRLLVGPATSLNIRNVTWHGFPAPGELPTQYAYVLLVLVGSIGKHLEDQGIEHQKIPRREFITFPQVDLLSEVIPEVEWLPYTGLINECRFVHKTLLPIWHVAVENHQKGRYGAAVSLLLPQLEHMLRCIFAEANQCPDRVLTAENTTLFTTFDEMLEMELPDGTQNKLREYLGDNIMDLIHDVLVYPSGPRVRDRVSHGETDINNFSASLSSQVFFLSAVICLRFLDDGPAHHKEEWILIVRDVSSKYKSVFHPIATVKKQIENLAANLEEWKDIKTLSDSMNFEELIRGEKETANEQRVYKAAETVFQRYIPNQLELMRCIEPFSTIEEDVKSILRKPITTIYRWKETPSSTTFGRDQQPTIGSKPTNGSESELVGYLKRVLLEVCTISRQVTELSRYRYQQWKNKDLRSRQRNNYIRMIKSVPILSSTLRLILFLAVGLILTLDDAIINSNIERLRAITLLRHVLQYSENVRTFTSPSSNKWDVAVAKTDEIICRMLKS